jgi:hypothetical protein
MVQSFIPTCIVLLMVLGIFLFFYSIIGFAKRNSPSKLKLPWNAEVSGPAWLISVTIGVLMVATPLIVSAIQKPDSVTIPPPPASVQQVQRIDEPNYRSFRFLRDISILDLRSVQEAPWYTGIPGYGLIEKKPRIRPGVLKNYMIVRKVDTASTIHITYSTSGKLDVRCPTHPCTFRISNRVIDGKEIETWEVIANVSTIAVGQEFEIMVEATYWNGFKDNNQEDYTTYAHGQTEPEQLSIMVMFPEDKPFRNISVTEYPPDGERGSPIQGQTEAWPGPNNQTYYWSINSQRPNWYYKITWQW